MLALQAFELYRFYHIGDEEIMALRGVDLTLEQGEFAAIVGPSGSGKSTLLACLAGLDEPDGGRVVVLGQQMTRRPEEERARLRARHIGMLMQVGNLFDHLTVRGNIRLQMGITGRGEPGGIQALLDGFGLGGKGDAYPARLSGGEAARAALAVALGTRPDLLICDEPTAEVDSVTEQCVLDRLEETCKAGRSALVATHSTAVADRADRVITIRDGRILDA